MDGNTNSSKEPLELVVPYSSPQEALPLEEWVFRMVEHNGLDTLTELDKELMRRDMSALPMDRVMTAQEFIDAMNNDRGRLLRMIEQAKRAVEIRDRGVGRN